MSNQKPWVIGLLVSNLLFLAAIVWLVLKSPEQPVTEPASDLAPAAADVADAPVDETAPAAPSAVPTEVEPTSVSVPDPTATATEIPATAVPEPTATPPPPEPTDTPAPADTPTPEPTPVPTVPAVPPPAWLSYFNIFREMAGVPTVTEQSSLTLGSGLHSKYMVVNDAPIAHAEDVNNPLYDEAGHLAAKNGNIFATSQLDADYVWGVNFWISGPFHLVPTLHPGLKTVGYGDYIEDIGNIHMAAVMDVRTDREYFPEGVTYPLYFPKNGSETWVVRHSLFEWPDPFGNCPGYGRPAGAPLVLQLGDGSLTPNVTSHTLVMGDQPIESCIFDETNYRNADAYAQEIGRTILDIQDAIVIMPKDPLPIDQTYTVQVVVDGETHTWSFSARKGPPE